MDQNLFLASTGFKACNVPASIWRPKPVISWVSSLSSQTVLLCDENVVIATVKMTVSWKWTPSTLHHSSSGVQTWFFRELFSWHIILRLFAEIKEGIVVSIIYLWETFFHPPITALNLLAGIDDWLHFVSSLSSDCSTSGQKVVDLSDLRQRSLNAVLESYLANLSFMEYLFFGLNLKWLWSTRQW